MNRQLAIVSICLLALCGSTPLLAEEGGRMVLTPPPGSSSSLDLAPGQSRVLRFPGIARAAIGNPAVADIAVLSKSELLLNAKAAGETLLYVQNEKGAASIKVEVVSTVKPLSDTAAAISQALEGTGVSATLGGETIFLRGRVATQEEADRLLTIARAFTPAVQSLIVAGRTPESVLQTVSDIVARFGVSARRVGDTTILIEGATTDEKAKLLTSILPQLNSLAAGFQVVNTSVGGATTRKVVIHVRVVDVEQAALRELGVDWGGLLYDDNGIVSGVGQPIIVGESRAPVGVLKGGPIKRLSNLGAAIEALETGNRAKMLTAPDLVTQDNRKATMLVGGEIPVPVPQTSSGQTVIVIQYKEYGVKLEVTPRIVDEDRVNLTLEPEVSTLDYTNAVEIMGYRVPALRTRRVNSEVTLKSGDTLVIGGLLQDLDENAIKKTPILSDIPLIGELFKYRTKVRNKTQLIVLVTPEILPEGANPPVPPLAGVKPDDVTLKPLLDTGVSRHDPPADRSLPESGPTPVPMSAGTGAAG